MWGTEWQKKLIGLYKEIIFMNNDIKFLNIEWRTPALAITPSHQQNTHDFADGRKNINDIFNNYVCSASHMRLEVHFQNV